LGKRRKRKESTILTSYHKVSSIIEFKSVSFAKLKVSAAPTSSRKSQRLHFDGAGVYIKPRTSKAARSEKRKRTTNGRRN